MKKLKVKNMSNFQLSSHIDANKVFLRKRSELENRLDPHQYHPERLGSIETLVKNNKCVKLRNCSIFRNVVTNNMSENDIYIGLENIESNTGKYVPNDQKSSISSANIFKKGQILFPKLRPYLNKVYQAEFDGICSTEFHILNADDGFLDEFLAIYLRSNIIVNQTKHLMTGNTLPRLQTQDIYNLPVPVISIVKQREIVSIYNKVNSIKQQKEQEAQNLLDSIDDYLMKELGIELPEVDNSLESRVFKTNFSKCQGKRLDSYYHQTKFDLYFKAFKKSVYPVQKLQNITRKITSGITPTSGGEDYVCQTDGIPFIRSGDIEINGDIDLSNLLYISKSIHNTEMKSSQLKENDILIAIVGATIGQVGIYKYQYEANINQAIALVRLKDGYNPNYIKEILKSFVGQINLEHLKRPVARANINLQEISQIQLIIPSSLEKQNQIVAHIQSIREQAKQLQNDAQQQFEEAKKEIERMILGER